jgi:lipopolysaccharide transport system permease protein
MPREFSQRTPPSPQAATARRIGFTGRLKDVENSAMARPLTVASRPQGSFDFLGSLVRHRSLLWQFVVRNVELRHRGSHLGLVWSFLNPLLMLGLYVFVFGYVFGGKFGALPDESRLDYALGVFLGLSLLHIVSETIGLAPGLIVANPNFVKKVVFPLEVLPAATVGASFFHFLVTIALVIAGVAFVGPGLSWGVLWLPVILLPVLALTLGVAWACSAIGVFFRDIAQVTGFVSMALLFSSAVFYPASAVPPAAWAVLKFNPLIHAIELARDAVLWGKPLDLAALAYLYACGLVGVLGGHWVFARLRPAFADVL